MRRLTLVVLLFALAWCPTVDATLWAQGRGKAGGGGGFRGGGFGGGKGVGKPTGGMWSDRGSGVSKGPAGMSGKPATGLGVSPRGSNSGSPFDVLGKNQLGQVGDQPWGKHYAREQQKLAHRRQVAEHLRQIGSQNGNQNLNRVASDMELRAQDHYQKQVAKLQQQFGMDALSDQEPSGLNPGQELVDDSLRNLPNAAAGNLVDPGALENLSESGILADRLTGTDNALYRQILNEERKLTQRMQVVEQMRNSANQLNDSDLLSAADRMEEWAMGHFDQRMEQITDFQQRHDLPEVNRYQTP